MKKQYVNGYVKSTASAKEKIAIAVLVGICIAAALVTFLTVTLVKKMETKPMSDKLAQNTKAEIQEKQEEVVVIEEVVSEKTKSYEKEVQSNRETSNEEPDNTKTVVSTDVLTFCAPCKGDIIQEFSPTVPLYSKTLDDWRIHNGIDIKAPLGADVCAVSDGKIEAATNDLRYGYTIVIDHGNSLKSIYSNLASIDGVSVGENIKKGCVIAKVGDTALFETVADTHLHFEMTKDGIYANPLSYFDLK